MHAASYGTRLRQARSESELRRTGLGALLGGPGALPQAFGTVENARARVWLCGKCQTGRRTRGLCASVLIRKKQSRPYRAARQSKTLDSGHTLLVSLPLEHAVEGAPGELGAFDAGGHVRDVLELGGFVQVFQVLLGELLAADHGKEELC